MTAFKVIVTRAVLIGLGILAGALPAVAQVFAPAQGKVENVVSKRDGTIITVTYDLTSTDPTSVFKVALSARMDGMTFTPVAVTGDIGDEVLPGKGKKIVWQVTKDTDSQDYDLFKFDVLAVSGKLKEVPSPEPAAAKPPVTAALPMPSDLRGTWVGSYANSATAELVVDKQTGATFAGRLKIAMKAGDDPTELSVEGTVTQQAIEVREVAVVNPGKLKTWNLGSGLGSLDADGRAMRGTGKDRRTTYTWTFSKQAPPPAPAPQAPDVQSPTPDPNDSTIGMWTGTYEGFQAQLVVKGRHGATEGPARTSQQRSYFGTLTVTTQKDRTPTVIDVDLLVTGTNVSQLSIREVRVVTLGAASNWKLSSNQGALVNLRMYGNKKSWALAKVPGK